MSNSRNDCNGFLWNFCMRELGLEELLGAKIYCRVSFSFYFGERKRKRERESEIVVLVCRIRGTIVTSFMEFLHA